MLAKRRISEKLAARDIAIGAGFLSRRAGVTRVWLFGSAAKGKRLDGRSDLDFAVEGLPPEQLERTWSELHQQLELPVDLIRLEAASETLRNEVRRWGKLLYESL